MSGQDTPAREAAAAARELVTWRSVMSSFAEYTGVCLAGEPLYQGVPVQHRPDEDTDILEVWQRRLERALAPILAAAEERGRRYGVTLAILRLREGSRPYTEAADHLVALHRRGAVLLEPPAAPACGYCRGSGQRVQRGLGTLAVESCPRCGGAGSTPTPPVAAEAGEGAPQSVWLYLRGSLLCLEFPSLVREHAERYATELGKGTRTVEYVPRSLLAAAEADKATALAFMNEAEDANRESCAQRDAAIARAARLEAQLAALTAAAEGYMRDRCTETEVALCAALTAPDQRGTATNNSSNNNT